ncbi:MAG TPA: chloride channel protein [Elusimicrobiota bacterium]|nr:chloride channel protein [Elusimicrobiota bacterium]
MSSPIRLAEVPALWTAAAVVGLGAGAASAVFLRLYEAARFWPADAGRTRLLSLTLTRPLLVAIPALGGLACGWIVQRFEPGARGTGTPELLHALRGEGPPLRARYAAWKTLASVFTTCSGGAAGPEGPMVTFGAGLAAWAGRRLKTASHAERVLTAAGAAAGFAAVFDAPAAGALFAVEVLLREFSPQSLSTALIAAAAGAAAADRLLGPREFLRGAASGASLRSPRELVFYLVLAAAAALCAKLFIETAIRVEKAFERLIASPAARAAAGGLLLGALGLLLPQALGNGYHDLPGIFSAGALAPLAASGLLLLLLGKTLGCPLTVGSGGSGGIFIPYLMMGASLGGILGQAVRGHFPWAAPASAYMLAGMGAVFAAITLAPLTSIALSLELTRNWDMALPLTVAVAAAVAIARAVEPESLDTRKLLKKGIRLRDCAGEWTVDTPAERAGPSPKRRAVG